MNAHITAAGLVAEAREKIREVAPRAFAEHRRDEVLIDVREPAEFETGHIPGSINIPRGVLEFRIHAHPALACSTSQELTRPDRPLLLYCLTGGRSALAADSLRQLGFSDVRSLAGGVAAWRNEALPLEQE